MTDIWDDLGDTSGFELPGDEARLSGAAEADTEAPVVENTAEVTEAPAVVEDATGRLHDPDTGQFVPKTEAEIEEAVAEVEEALILGKFKTADELAAAYAELEKHTGTLRNEVGERRKAEEELAARLAAIEQQVSRPAPVQISDSLIEQNPAHATQLAYEQGNQAALAAAFEYWKDEDPVGAATWLADAKAEARIREIEARHEERFAQLEQRVAPQEAAASDAAYRAALAQVSRDHPDLEQFIPAMSAIAEANPVMQRLVSEGSPEDAAETFRTLYKLAKAEQGSAVAETAQSVARSTAEEAQKVREEAFVASASTTAGGEKPSLAETIGAEWENFTKPYEDGWNV